MGADRDGATGGTYTLLIALEEDASVETGSLGTVELPAGHYAYTGSALGPGGFARVDRHREVAAGERDVRQWHVDHLLGQEAATATAAIRSPGGDVECAVAAQSTPRRSTASARPTATVRATSRTTPTGRRCRTLPRLPTWRSTKPPRSAGTARRASDRTRG
jgi:Uri superfamily endonuclease